MLFRSEIQKWVDVMVKNGQPYIDTARAYGDGTAEKASGIFVAWTNRVIAVTSLLMVILTFV